MPQKSTCLWRSIVGVLLGMGLVATACIAPDPDLRGWRCDTPQECGSSHTYFCHEHICRFACDTGKSCPSNELCFAGLVCLPNPAPEILSPDGSPSEITPETAGPCKEGEQRPCFTAQEGQRNKGICKDGLQICKDGTWGSCIGEIAPVGEVCDDGLDNNCDGSVDEGCKCQKGDLQPCGSSTGECKPGIAVCLDNGVWSTTCEGAKGPTDEICDGKDNDCNGQIDEAFLELRRPCFAGKGVCKVEGKFICDPTTRKTTCDGKAKAPQTEICNNLDDDCDGIIDNVSTSGEPRLCNIPGLKGECAKGQIKCINGQEVCAQVNFIQTEICNRKDDDCNGLLDNAPGVGTVLTQSCYTGPGGSAGVGNCKKGRAVCKEGKWETCQNEVTPAPETCDGTDEDCNGQIDDVAGGCACSSGDTEQCGPKGGECVQGSRNCNNGKWSDCKGARGPAPELCDGKDNDCNGKVDDGISPVACTVSGQQGPCAAGATTCTGGKVVCMQTVQPRAETCDGQDTNCDGKSDVCKQGDLRCANNNVERCKSDCEGWEVSVTCKSTERCENNLCVDQCQCTPGQMVCGQDWTYNNICKADCSGYELTQCPSNQRCLNDACRQCSCTPGDRRCDPANKRNAQECACTSWNTYGSCPSGYECAKSGQGNLYCKRD